MSFNAVTEETIQKAKDFHGHMCPGLAIGIRAAEIALRDIGPASRDEEIVALVETDMCAVDAIQVLTGCTFGKGNLIHQDFGKKAFSFYRRSDGKSIRIVTLPSAMSSTDPEREALLAKHLSGSLTAEEQQRFETSQLKLSDQILRASLDSLFVVKKPPQEVPTRARIHESHTCEACGEAVMATRVRKVGDRTLCIPCAQQ